MTKTINKKFLITVYSLWNNESFWWQLFIKKKRRNQIVYSLIFYREDFFNTGVLPNLANHKKLNIKKFLKIRVHKTKIPSLWTATKKILN